MIITVDYKGVSYKLNANKPLPISIPIGFEGEGVSVFGAPFASSEAYSSSDFVGDVNKGGSCNCKSYNIIPHCNGTHTECIGHITKSDIHISDVMEDSFLLAKVFTVMPELAGECDETYNESMEDTDLVITQKSLQVLEIDRAFRALVLRTLPNENDKLSKNYNEQIAPYFTREAMEYIATSKFMHVLVDMPSVDRLVDGGELINHRTFWGVDEGDKDAPASPKTITELIYVPDHIEDGSYFLNLQICDFKADTTPSRPVLYAIEENG